MIDRGKRWVSRLPVKGCPPNGALEQLTHAIGWTWCRLFDTLPVSLPLLYLRRDLRFTRASVVPRLVQGHGFRCEGYIFQRGSSLNDILVIVDCGQLIASLHALAPS